MATAHHAITAHPLPSDRKAINVVIGCSFVILITVALIAIVAGRRRRRLRQMQAVKLSLCDSRNSLHSTKDSRLTVTVTPLGAFDCEDSVHEKRKSASSSSSSSLQSPVPEIRITFPEEYDDMGKPRSGQVLLVRVGEHTECMEPIQESLPSYQKGDSDRFESLDFDRDSDFNEKRSLV